MLHCPALRRYWVHSQSKISQQGDLARMAAVSSYLQGLYSSVVQSFSADAKYSGGENFSASDSRSTGTKYGESHRNSRVTTYVTEGSVV